MIISLLLRDEVGKEYFLQYCTISDIVICEGMNESKFRKHLALRGWNKSEINYQISICRKKGTTDGYAKSAIDILRTNRTGKKEIYLTFSQIIEYFCKRKRRRRQK